MNTLESWTEAACAELGIDPAVMDTRMVLDVARDTAHQVARPAAPLTAYLMGVAVGGGLPPDEAAGRIRELAARWPAADAAG
jgi:Domain of unknown function (DUF6457)